MSLWVTLARRPLLGLRRATPTPLELDCPGGKRARATYCTAHPADQDLHTYEQPLAIRLNNPLAIRLNNPWTISGRKPWISYWISHRIISWRTPLINYIVSYYFLNK